MIPLSDFFSFFLFFSIPTVAHSETDAFLLELAESAAEKVALIQLSIHDGAVHVRDLGVMHLRHIFLSDKSPEMCEWLASRFFSYMLYCVNIMNIHYRTALKLGFDKWSMIIAR